MDGNLAFVVRSARTSNTELVDLAEELVRAMPDLLVASGTPPSLALKQATTAIPIVVVNVGNPVATGLVQSLARPGGNVTGTANAVEDWRSKSLQMVNEFLPGLRCLAFLRNAANASIVSSETATSNLARKLGFEVRLIDITTQAELDQVLATAPEAGCASALFLPLDTLLVANRAHIANYALSHKIALFAPFREDAEVGALISFGVNIDEQWRLAASYVDRLLKGAKPADLPVQQPTKFEMVINMKTAKALGLTVPPLILARADEVIE